MTTQARPAPLGHRRLRRLFVVALVVAGILFTFANPARSWFGQRQDITAARQRNAVLEVKSRELQARADQLRTDAEVERIARQEYGLIKPGEEAFGVLPSPGSVQAPPPPPPPPEPRRWWQRAWDTLSS